MRIILCYSLLLTGLVLSGCDSTEQTTTKQEPEKQRVVETKKTQLKTSSVPADKPVAEQLELKEEPKQETADSIVTTSSNKTTEIVETSEKIVEDAVKKEKTENAVAEGMTKEAIEKVAVVKEKPLPKSITLEASYGNITFPHEMHADSYACTSCHKESPPIAFDITKEVAHKTCKGCHKDEGAGPTGCKGCHVK